MTTTTTPPNLPRTTKFVYSDSNMILNELYIQFPVSIKQIPPINNNNNTNNNNTKQYQTRLLRTKENANVIQDVAQLEQKILNMYVLYHGIDRAKHKCCSISTYLQNISSIEKNVNANVNAYANEEMNMDSENHVQAKCIVKLCSIWESNMNIGISFQISFV